MQPYCSDAGKMIGLITGNTVQEVHQPHRRLGQLDLGRLMAVQIPFLEAGVTIRLKISMHS